MHLKTSGLSEKTRKEYTRHNKNMNDWFDKVGIKYEQIDTLVI